MVKISYTRIKTRFFRESERERKNQVAFYYFIQKFFCKIRQNNRMQLSAVCFNFEHENNEQTLHTLKNTGLKTTQFGLDKYRTEHVWG